MMKKKLSAFLAALCGLSFAAIPAYADDAAVSMDYPSMERTVTLVESFTGGVCKRDCSTQTWLLVETDGTELTAENVQDLANFSSINALEWSEYEETIYPDLSIEYGTTIYKVDFSTLENLRNTARLLQMQHDFVKNVYFVRSKSDSTVIGPFGLRLKPIDTNITLYYEDFPQLRTLNQKVDAKDGYWYGALSLALQEERDSLYEISSYQAYLYTAEIAQEILSEHSDILYNAEAYYSGSKATYTICYSTQSIWQTAGDPNADGAVDAKDAASILQTAAENGTGAGIAATSATDVNADGEVNAKDAAAVLVYAAEAGTGKTPDWVEILRRR